jgi:capsular polysaccharide biosynthesis protein
MASRERTDISSAAPAASRRFLDVLVNESGELFESGGVLEASFETLAAFEARDKARYTRRARRLSGELDVLPGSYLWITDRLSHFYYHWFCDALPRLELALEAEPDAATDLLLPERILAQPFVRESLRAWPEVTVTVLAGAPGTRVAELRVPVRAAETPQVHGPLVQRVAARVKGLVSGDIKAGWRRIFVSREGSRIRRVENERELAAILCARGFEIVAMENMALADQIALMRETRWLAGAHGGGLTNMLFMPVPGSVLELRRGEGPPPCYRNLASALGHGWSDLSCRATDLSVHPHAADIFVDPALLDSALADLLRQ